MVENHPLYIEVARQAKNWSAHENVGLVVGTTKPEALKSVLKVAPELPYLLPGSGAQGVQLECNEGFRRSRESLSLEFRAQHHLRFRWRRILHKPPREEVLRLQKRTGKHDGVKFKAYYPPPSPIVDTFAEPG